MSQKKRPTFRLL